MEENKTSSAVSIGKAMVMAFLVGGMLSVVGQVYVEVLTLILGPNPGVVNPLTLILMGLTALVLYTFGLYQKLEALGGFGASMPFSGFAAGCAAVYGGIKEATGSKAKGIWGAAKLLIYAGGTGMIFAAVFAFFLTFVL